MHPSSPACHTPRRPQAGTTLLDHAATYAALERFLRAQPQPLRLLELGCGDARHTAALLHRATAAGCSCAGGCACGNPGALQLSGLTSVDVSAAALALARRNLAGMPCGVEAELVQQDMKVMRSPFRHACLALASELSPPRCPNL